MSDKNLTELEWKKFAKGRNLKDGALVKALADLERAARTGPDAQLAALADIEKQADSLRKSAKGDKELAGYMDDLDKALDKQRKLSEFEARKAAKAASEEEEEETPALLTTKMVPLLRQVKKGEEMAVLLASTGKEVAVMLSRRAISPSRRKLLTTYLDGGTPKFFAGTCIFEDNAYTFVLKTQAGGLAKKVKAALLKQVELRLRVRVRGEDPNDVDEELGDADDGDETPGAGADLRAAYEQTKKSLYPRISAAVREGAPNKDRIVTLMGQAQKTEGIQDWAAGTALYAQLAALLPAAPAAAPASPAPTPAAAQPDTDDLKARYETRSAQLTPRALAALKAQQGDVSKIRAVAEFARGKADEGNYKSALAAFDQLEKLLGTPPAGGNAQGQTMTADTQMGLTKSRLAWEQTRKKVQSELHKLEQSILDICKDEPDLSEIAAGTRNLSQILEYLDERLIDKLDEALNAEPAARRLALHDEAREIVGEYVDFVNSEDLMQDIDNNGFVPVSIRSLLTTSLSAIGKQLAATRG